MPELDLQQPWKEIRALLATGDADALYNLISNLSQGEVARALTFLDDAEQHDLLTLLDPEDAADLIEGLVDAMGADIIEDLPAHKAAAIVDEMESDHRADLLGEMDSEDAEAILHRMDPEEAEDARRLLKYPDNTAGGIMVTEFVVYPQDKTVADVVRDLRENAELYTDYGVQYAYVESSNKVLVGVLRLRDLLLTPPDKPLHDIMIVNPIYVLDETPLDELNQLFDRCPFWGIPVTTEDGKMIGVVRRADMEEAHGEEQGRAFLRFSGIIGGEELRSMPVTERASRRLVWLCLNIALSIVAASVILFFESTISRLLALVFFIPVINNMCGCSGNQAVAVSIRELSLGLIQPGDFVRVWRKEIAVGLINGAILGTLLATIALILNHFLWHDSVFLALVVGLAYVMNTAVAVSLGGLIPLGLRMLGLDPALAAPPILTTLTDMCGLILVLSFATLAIFTGLI